ncbi:DUF1499 domain-containing protein [Candidatus Binatus sp.]|jgi:uncharacterized protein (DUF1499 family)|uniref:DUF1499 domain-containing protein n=1 Tax=Candidatus Binatus sp. TaxID=2811406 RepID=UPI003CA2B476
MTFAWLAFFDALLAITMILVGVIGAHFYFVPAFLGFQLFALGFLLSIIGSLVGLLAIFLTRTPQLRAGRNRAVVGTVICALIAVPMIIIVLSGSKYPPINDITTDFDDSPEFVYAEQLQHEPNRDMKYNKAKYADRQLAGYGPIGPIKERLSPADAYARVIEVAQAIPTWKITYKDPATDTFEAVATSRLFHFHDDVVIQIRPTPDGASLIEMRSKSRDGIGDFGVNAKRIRHFYDRVALARSPSDQNPADQDDVP